MIKFVIYTVLIVPVVVQAVAGFLKKADFAWFFHPVACWITLWEYGWGRISSFFRTAELSRDGWGQ